MKKIVFPLLSAVFCISSVSGVTVTTFGTSSSFSTDAFNSFSTTENTNSIELSGTGQSTFSGTFNTVDVASSFSNGLSLSGSVSDLVSAPFVIELFDSSNRGAVFDGGSWDDLSNVGESVLTLDSQDSGFDGSSVSALELRQSGPPDSLNVTFTELSTVPEPTAYGSVAGTLALVYVALRRRQRG